MSVAQPFRVLIVDDSRHAREGMRDILADDPYFTVAGEAASGEEGLAMMDEAMPDLVLMDIGMPGMGGLEAAKAIKTAYPYVKIVMVTVSDEAALLFEALKKGAQGFLLKNLNPAAWREYLRAVALDEAPMNPELALQILREFGAGGGSRTGARTAHRARKDGGPLREGLTAREKEILQEVARGKTNREVAAALGLSEHTVKNHLKNILQKLHLNNRVQLTRYAYESGLVDPERGPAD
jgi:DNA-binding NarL/FixJ family response regulator